MLKAINISANEAALMRALDDDEVLISINNPFEDLHPVGVSREDPRVLTVVFADVTYNFPYKEKVYKVINEETATTLVKFIEKFKDKNFIVHCTAGVSRSAAVCMYIHTIYRHALRNDFLKVSFPNNYVLGKLISMRHFLFE